MNYFVYVLLSGYDETHYIGSTEDIFVRLEMHNQGRCRSTKMKRPWKIVYEESFETRSQAVQRERFLKSGAGRRFLKDKLTVKI